MITARWVRALAGASAMALVLASPAALAQNNQLKQVDANVVGEQTVFTVDLQGPLSQKPADFTTQNPAKIAIDFFDTGFAQGRAQYEYAGKLLKSANVMQIGDRTRVVLNLARNATYRTEMRGNQFVVLMDNVAQAAAAAVVPTFAPAASATQPVAANPGVLEAGRAFVERGDLLAAAHVVVDDSWLHPPAALPIAVDHVSIDDAFAPFVERGDVTTRRDGR